jgi:hypothetical protein
MYDSRVAEQLLFVPGTVIRGSTTVSDTQVIKRPSTTKTTTETGAKKNNIKCIKNKNVERRRLPRMLFLVEIFCVYARRVLRNTGGISRVE